MKYIRHMLWRCVIADYIFRFSGQPVKELVIQDVDRNLKWKEQLRGKSSVYRLNYLLLTSREFRSIYYFRMKHHPHLVSFSRKLLRDIETIEFGNGGIGGGLMISHYHAVIFPLEAGKNLRVGPGVVIGRNNGQFPRIGNNVYIAANSTIIGDITIGDNVIVGAGSVVTKDLPSNGVYVGNPAKYIKSINDNDQLLNEII